jgi:hypothetical protein
MATNGSRREGRRRHPDELKTIFRRPFKRTVQKLKRTLEDTTNAADELESEAE